MVAPFWIASPHDLFAAAIYIAFLVPMLTALA
jgi:hypothetical protein